MSIRPRRSVLFMPGSNARAIEKARTLPADCIVLDLEDSVAPDGKEAAREQVMAAVAAGGFGAREVVVRINGLDTAWWLEDVNAAARAKPDAILVPKVSSPGHLEDVAERFVDISADHKIRIWAMMETPLAVLQAREIAAAGIGCGDPSRLLGDGHQRSCQGDPRAHPAGPRTDAAVVDDLRRGGARLRSRCHRRRLQRHQGRRGLALECAAARDMGFDGKSVIHPDQIEAANALLFSERGGDCAGARHHRCV